MAKEVDSFEIQNERNNSRGHIVRTLSFAWEQREAQFRTDGVGMRPHEDESEIAGEGEGDRILETRKLAM